VPYDKKQFLDLLLQEHKSEETRKARRNLSTISFVIFATWWLNIGLANIKFLGIDISGTTELPVLMLAATLLIYWAVMFFLAWKHDREIQRERALLLDEQVKPLIARLDVLQRDMEARKNNPTNWTSPDYPEVKAAVEAYKAQQERTKQASLFGSLIKHLEFYVPLLLSGGAAIVLTCGVIQAARC